MTQGIGGGGASAARGRPRTPALVQLVCLLALGVVVWGAIAQTEYAVLPPGQDAEQMFEAGATVGAHVPTGPAHLDYLVRRHFRPGQEVDFGPGDVHVLVSEAEDALLWITLLNALAFWAVCAFALAPRLDVSGIQDLFATLLLASVAIAIGGVSYPHVSWAGPLTTIYVWAISFMPAFFVRFALAFPRRLPTLDRLPRLPLALLVISAGVALWNTVAWLQCFAAPPTEDFSRTEAPTAVQVTLLIGGGILGCLTLWWNGRQARTAREKRQVKWILFSIAIGAAPYVIYRKLLGAPEIDGFTIPPIFDRIVEMAIPAALAIAVVKERFLDIDVIIRRSLLYTFLAVGGGVVFFVTAAVIGDVLAAWLGIETYWTWGVAGVLTGLQFRPARRIVGRWIDRTFFRIRFEHGQALDVLQRTLAEAGGQAELATRLDAFLEDVLEPKTHGVLVASGDASETSGPLNAEVMLITPDLIRDLVAHRPLARPGATACPELESEAFPSRLADAGIEVVQPVTRDGRLQAVLALGARRTGRRWVQEDLELMEAAAGEVATALERLELVQRVAEEALERRALAELTRQKADFFARIAHDLRTPITAVRWSTQNLLDGLPGPITDRQGQYLDSVAAAAGQLERLVTNLVDLGRLDLHAPQRPAEPVDLKPVVEEAATALVAVATKHEATIEIDAPDDLPRLRGRTESVFQVVINLIENALKHAPAGTPVEVGLHESDGEVVLTVRDHGPGLPHEGRDRLFDLFQQGGDEDDRRKGYGIGLYIVRSWMESMGGRVEADDHPDGGARFTCTFVPWSEKGDPA